MRKSLIISKERHYMGLEDMEGLLRHLQSKRDVSQQYDLKTVGKLSDCEVHEYNIISANGDALNKEFTRLINRRQEMEAKNTLFWASLRRNHSCMEDEFLHLEPATEGMLLQTGTKKENPSTGNPLSDLFGQ
jgi:hypothetical protein